MVAFSFITVSIIEYIGVIVAMLALFRYPVNHYWPQIAFTSTICSVLSYVLSVDHDVATAPLIQLVVLALSVWLMFNTPLIWSMIMCTSFFIVYAVVQGGIIYVLFWFDFVPAIVPKTSISMYLIQIFCSAGCLLLGYYWLRKRIGFLFIPTSRDVPFIWNKAGLSLFIGSVIAFLSMGAAYALFSKTHFKWFSILLAVLIIVSVGFLYSMKRRNKEYVEKPWTR